MNKPQSWDEIKPGDIVTVKQPHQRTAYRMRVVEARQSQPGTVGQDPHGNLIGVILNKDGSPARKRNNYPLADERGYATGEAGAYKGLHLSMIEDVETPSTTAPVKPLTENMKNVMLAAEFDGFINANNGVPSVTITALVRRGLLREYSPSYRCHFVTTTPEQVWDEAQAEYDRRDAEAQAHAVCPETWMQADEGRTVQHVRRTRQGQLIELEQRGHHFWNVRIDGCPPMSACGDFEEARRSADRFERGRVHAEALAEDEAQQNGRAMIEQAAAQLGVDLETGEDIAPTGTLRVNVTSVNAKLAAVGRGPLPVANPPAEARTGFSDRVAAALADVAALRNDLDSPLYADMIRRLDRIEAALREQR